MEFVEAKAFLAVVRSEEKRRSAILDHDEPDQAYDQWVFCDAPFIAELCIMLLVSLRHHVERRLLFLAACALDHGARIKRAQYEKHQAALARLDPAARWKEILKRLKLSTCDHFEIAETLRLLANAYKHDPKEQPTKPLLRFLNLDPTINYLELRASDAFKKGLALKVGLAEDAAFVDVTERFIENTDAFLKDVPARNTLSKVSWGPISLAPKDAGH
jgi:hypothetical protein